eukprot:2985401-Karenia_brevis.AAC.1
MLIRAVTMKSIAPATLTLTSSLCPEDSTDMSSTKTVRVTVAQSTYVWSTTSNNSILSSVVAVPDPAVMPHMATMHLDMIPSIPMTLLIRYALK